MTDLRYTDKKVVVNRVKWRNSAQVAEVVAKFVSLDVHSAFTCQELTNTSKSAAKQHLPDHKELAKRNVLFTDPL